MFFQYLVLSQPTKKLNLVQYLLIGLILYQISFCFIPVSHTSYGPMVLYMEEILQHLKTP